MTGVSAGQPIRPLPIIALHLSGNLAWIQRVWNRGREDREFGLATLDAALGAFTAVCLVTGFPIWLEWSDAGIWSGVHAITGFASIVLMFVHLWWNRRRIVRLVRP